MKRAVTILCAAVMLTGLCCQKKSGQPVEPSKYDKSVDGPPSAVAFHADENVSKDQSALSSALTVSAAPAVPPAGTTQPTASAPATGPAETPPATAPVATAPATAPPEAAPPTTPAPAATPPATPTPATAPATPTESPM